MSRKVREKRVDGGPVPSPVSVLQPRSSFLSRSLFFAGKLRRVPGRRELYRTKTEKKVYVRIADESTTEAGTAAAAAAQLK